MRQVLIFTAWLLLAQQVSASETEESFEPLSNKARQPHIQVELIAERPSAERQSPRVGVLFKPDPDWHIYWRNPGDTGLAPAIQWQGVKASGELKWPFPEYIPIAHLVNLGYHYETLLWAEADASNSSGKVQAQVDWLVCKEECIPGSAKLSLDLNQIDESASSAATALFDKWQTKLPQAFPLMDAFARVEDGKLALEIYASRPLFNEVNEVELFVENLDLVVYGKPLKQRALKNVLLWEQKLSEFKTENPDFVRAVIVIDRSTAYSLALPIRKT